jgi:type IV secretory pathway VirB10-like protein
MSDPSSSARESSANPAPVTDWRRTPLGVIPRHLQQWVLVGVALVMVGIMALSGPSAKPRTTAASSPTTLAVDPNQQRIEEYQRRIQEQAQRLAAEQAQLQLTKEAVGASPEARPTGRGPRVLSDAPRPTPSAPSEWATREERGRVADNVAFSRSRGAVGAEPSATPTAPAHAARPDVAPVAPPITIGPSGAPGLGATSMVARQATAPLVLPTASASGDGPRYRVFEGTLIETVLTNRLDGTFTGPVNCLVSVPVYASDQQHVVIPAGARVLGEARAVNTFGQSRLAVVFHRVLLPNGTRVDLDGFHGLNQVGDLGLRDQVDRHYAQIFGVSLAIGAIAGFAQAQSTVGLDATGLDVYRQGAAASVSQSSARILDRFLNLLPTVTIREGHRIKVYLSNDLELPAYRDTLPTPGGRP